MKRLARPQQESASAEAPRFYGVAQAARIFQLSSMTLYRAIEAGEFPAIRIRGRLIVPAKAVDEMVEAALSGWTSVNAADWVAEGAA